MEEWVEKAKTGIRKMRAIDEGWSSEENQEREPGKRDLQAKSFIGPIDSEVKPQAGPAE